MARTALLEDHLTWSVSQRSGEPNFVYLTTWAGLANRLIALLSAFVLSILTRRVLVLDEDAFPEPLLAAPVAWDVASWPQFGALRAAQEAAVAGGAWMTTDTADWLTIDTERRPFSPTLQRLGCSNLSGDALPQRVLHFHSIAQYLVPLLLLNPAADELRHALGSSPVARLAKYVLRPSPAFEAAVRAHPSVALLPRPLLGVQLRMHNNWVRRGTPRLRESARTCAVAMARAHGAAAAHLASDDLEARDELAAQLRPIATAASAGAGAGAGAGGGSEGGGARVAGAEGVASAAARLQVGTLEVDGATLRAENMSSGWLELLLLARCDGGLLTTGGSSFGYVARALSDAPLRRQRVLTRWEELEKRAAPFALADDCPVLRTREPCLMHAWRDDWQLARLPCWDASRFTPQVARHLIDPLGPESHCFR